MAAAVAVGQQLVLNKSAFLSVQCLLKHVCESVTEGHRDKERGLTHPPSGHDTDYRTVFLLHCYITAVLQCIRSTDKEI